MKIRIKRDKKMKNSKINRTLLSFLGIHEETSCRSYLEPFRVGEDCV